MQHTVRTLVVDDDKDMRLVIAAALGLEPALEVRAVGSVAAALELVRRWPPDIVLMDFRMPQLSGLDGIPLLRREERMESVPIIIVTTEHGPADRARYLRGGASAVITKPFDPFALAPSVQILARASVGGSTTGPPWRPGSESTVSTRVMAAKPTRRALRCPLEERLRAAASPGTE